MLGVSLEYEVQVIAIFMLSPTNTSEECAGAGGIALLY